MTDFSRLVDYIDNYFPDPSHTQTDIRKWAKKGVPAWKHMDKKTKDGIIKDWKYFQEPKTPEAPRVVDKPRDTRGRFKKARKVDRFTEPRTSRTVKRKFDRPRDARGRFTKVVDKVKKFLGRSY